MSHGVPRARQSAEALEARKQKDKAKLDHYLTLVDDVLSRKGNKEWTQDAFEATTRLLQINPELYTVWNYRRNIMTNGLFPDVSAKQVNDMLSDDLDMTTAALKQHPKVYWIWNHRRWCLEHIPEGSDDTEGDPLEWRKKNWARELFVVEKMLDADARNFHAWNYRRYVLASMPVKRTNRSELTYTTRKIEANFSNFSAWHQRTKVLTAMWAAGEADPVTTREKEFELVQNALWTNPADQSAWLYHRWLIGKGDDHAILNREIDRIQELLDEQPDRCMETLVHYKRLVLPSLTAPRDRAKALGECMSLLQTLKETDPMRQKRYEELGQPDTIFQLNKA